MSNVFLGNGRSMMLVACHDCDLLQEVPSLVSATPCLPGARGAGGSQSRWTMAVVAECPRCGAVLRRTQRNSVSRTLAWVMAGLVLYCVAVFFPFLAMQAHGMANETGLLTGIVVLSRQGMGGMGLVVLLTCLVVPLFTMLTLLYILIPIQLGRRCLPFAARLFVWNQRLRLWGMMEVYLLAILVSMVKLAKLAKIIPGPALYSFVVLVFVLAAASVSLDSHQVWEAFPLAGRGGERP